MSDSISVVVTCYREGELLRRAVASLRQQDDGPFEIVVVNDASPDEITNRICRELEAEGGVRVVWREVNGGLSAARNSGCEAMRGEICVPLDADDLLPADALRSIRETFWRHPDADFVFGNYFLRDVERGTVAEIDCSVLASGGRLDPSKLARRDWIFYGGSPYRKRVWGGVGGFRAEFSYDTQDVDFWMRVMVAGFQGNYAGRVIYEWNRSASGMNARVEDARWIETRLRNIAFYDRFGDGIAARRELLFNALSNESYSSARTLARQLVRLGRISPLYVAVAALPRSVLRALHRMHARARAR